MIKSQTFKNLVLQFSVFNTLSNCFTFEASLSRNKHKHNTLQIFDKFLLTSNLIGAKTIYDTSERFNL